MKFNLFIYIQLLCACGNRIGAQSRQDPSGFPYLAYELSVIGVSGRHPPKRRQDDKRATERPAFQSLALVPHGPRIRFRFLFKRCKRGLFRFQLDLSLLGLQSSFFK